jgi:hypothetical protein
MAKPLAMTPPLPQLFRIRNGSYLNRTPATADQPPRSLAGSRRLAMRIPAPPSPLASASAHRPQQAVPCSRTGDSSLSGSADGEHEHNVVTLPDRAGVRGDGAPGRCNDDTLTLPPPALGPVRRNDVRLRADSRPLLNLRTSKNHKEPIPNSRKSDRVSDPAKRTPPMNYDLSNPRDRLSGFLLIGLLIAAILQASV